MTQEELKRECLAIAKGRYEKFENPEEGVEEFFKMFMRDNNCDEQEAIAIYHGQVGIQAWLDGWMSARHFYQFRNECAICHSYIDENLYGCNVCDLCNEEYLK